MKRTVFSKNTMCLFICFYVFIQILMFHIFSIKVICDGGFFSPLSFILKDNSLNYVDWKRNTNIVLPASEYKYILTDPCLEFGENSSYEDKRLRGLGRTPTRWLVAICWLPCPTCFKLSTRMWPLHMTLMSL